MTRALVATVLVVFAAALGAQAAFGCSCAPPDRYDDRQALANAEGAIFGEVLERRAEGERVILRMRVIERFKGDIGPELEVETASNGGLCGLALQVGDQSGLLLGQRDGRWVGGSCGQRTLDELRAAARAPRPRSSGPIRMVVAGEFGPERVAALDGRGRLVRLGPGDGDATRIAACPGGQRVIEGVHRPDVGWALAVRDVATMKVRRTLDLDLHRYDEAVSDLRCDSAGGRLARIAVVSTQGGARVISVAGRAATTTWRAAGSADQLSPRISLGRRYAWMVASARLLRIDPASGTARDLGARPAQEIVLAVSPDERRLLTGSGYRPGHVHQIDARTGNLVRSLEVSGPDGAHWLGRRSIALEVEDGLRFTDARWRVRATVPGGGAVAVHAGRLTLVSGRGMQIYDAEGRPVGPARRLFTPAVRRLVVLPKPVRRRARATAAGACAWRGVRPPAIA